MPILKVMILICSCAIAVSCQEKKVADVTSEETNSKVEEVVKQEKKQRADAIVKSDEEWKKELNEQEFYVLRKAGTERPFTGDLLDNKEDGVYTCRGCGLELFDSKTKFKSGTGWPSYYEPIDKVSVGEDTDHKLGYARTEVHCARCDGHLGHVFTDGPQPTGLRYCINSVSLDFKTREEEQP